MFGYHRQFLKIWLDSSFKNKNTQTITSSSEKKIKNSKRKPNLTEGGRDTGFLNSFFQHFLYRNNIKLYSKNTFLGVLFIGTARDLFRKPVFEREDAQWIDVLHTITKQCKK